MTSNAPATAFVTGAAGFIGTALIKVLVAGGHQVFGLAHCAEAAQRVLRAGAAPVMGDLLEPGLWQDEAAADWVFHLPPHLMCGLHATSRRAASLARARVMMDAHLLDAVAGATPSVCGRALMPALDRLDGYVIAGLPIVTALRRRVLQHPPARDWLPLRVPHARAGSPANSRSAG